VCTRCQTSATPVAKHIITHGITPSAATLHAPATGQLILCLVCLGEGTHPATLDQCPRCMGTGLESDQTDRSVA
jgi:DnaJ-class molecular chaperone